MRYARAMNNTDEERCFHCGAQRCRDCGDFTCVGDHSRCEREE